MIEGYSNHEKLPLSVESVETPNGKYRLVYSNHFIQNQESELGGNYAGVVFEGIISPPEGRQVSDVIKESGRGWEKEKQYSKIFAALAQEGKPAFITDVHGHSGEMDVALYGVPAAEWILANAVFKNKELPDGASMTRRDFLTRSAKTVAHYYLKGDVVAKILASTASLGAGTRTPANIAEKMYPQSSIYTLTLRNLVAAEKMEKLYQQNKTEFQGKELVVVYGAFHSGLAEALKMGHEARLQKIQSILKVLATLNINLTPDELALTLTLHFDPGRDGWFISNVAHDSDLLAMTGKAMAGK